MEEKFNLYRLSDGLSADCKMENGEVVSVTEYPVSAVISMRGRK